MYLVTGSCGFIGYHFCKSMLQQGYDVLGIDSINDYYSLDLKYARLSELNKFENFKFVQLDISDYNSLKQVLDKHDIEYIVHLAAQPGVRYSIENPFSYNKSNLDALLSVLELARYIQPKNFIFASSSSVYGKNNSIPFREDQVINDPASYYAATKIAGEAMCKSYSNLYSIKATGLRFFTVYGPYGRPDMAVYSFTQDILDGKPIKLFNNGNVRRDFTYIDDIVKGIESALNHKGSNFEIFNLGNNKCEEVSSLISLIEGSLGKKAIIENYPMQSGDVVETWADLTKSEKLLNFIPKTNLKDGIPLFINWFLNYNANISIKS